MAKKQNTLKKQRLLLLLSAGLILIILFLPFFGLVNSLAQTTDVPVGSFKGDYFNGAGLKNYVATKTDPKVDFSWGSNSPLEGVNKDNFSVRWEGYFFFNSGTYTFKANSDDGVRVYLDDQMIINGWVNQQFSRSYFANKTLENKAYKVKVEYFDTAGAAQVKVDWFQSENTPAKTTSTTTGNGTEKTNEPTLSYDPNLPRCISFDASQVVGMAPFTLRFTAIGFDPNGEISEYEFVTGEKQNGEIVSVKQKTNQLTYTYDYSGNFTASVVMYDSKGTKVSQMESCPNLTIKVSGTPQIYASATSSSEKLPDTGPSDLVYLIAFLGAGVFGFVVYKKFRLI